MKIFEKALEKFGKAAETVSKRRRSCAAEKPILKHQEVEKYKGRRYFKNRKKFDNIKARKNLEFKKSEVEILENH